MRKDTSDDTQIVTLAAQLRGANDSIRQLRASIRVMQQFLARQSELSNVFVKIGRNRAVAKTTIECDSGFDDEFYVCAADETDAEAAAKQAALKEYECGKNCMMSFTLVSAKRTGLICQRGTPEWKVTLTLFCSKAKK